MLRDILVRYLRDIEASVRSMEGAHVERYEEEALGDNRVNVRIRVRQAIVSSESDERLPIIPTDAAFPQG